MRFATLPIGEAQGAILVHGLRVGSRMFKKGRVLSQADVGALGEAGIAEVTAVKLEAGGAPPDLAATRVARARARDGIRVGAPLTSPAKLHALNPGVPA